MENQLRKVVIKPALNVINFRKIYYNTWKFFPKRVFCATHFQVEQIINNFLNPRENFAPKDELEALLTPTPVSKEETLLALAQFLTNKNYWRDSYNSELKNFFISYEIAFGQQYHTLEPESVEIFSQAKENFFYSHMLSDFYNQAKYDIEDINKLLCQSGFRKFSRQWYPKARRQLVKMMRRTKKQKALFKKSY